MSTISEKLQIIAENQKKIYEAGKAAGGDTDAAYQQGVTDGKQAEYDRFWDAYQQNGNITRGDYMYAGSGWTDDTFKPKYLLTPTWAYYMFRWSGIKDGSNLKVDFSNCTDMYMCFAGSQIETLPEIRATGNNVDMYNCFNACYSLKRIEKLVLGDSVRRWGDMFTGCGALEHMIVEGVIDKSMNLQWSPLSVDSMKSIILCLKDYSGTDKEYAYTLTFNDECWAALEAEGNTAPGDISWAEYVGNKRWNA